MKAVKFDSRLGPDNSLTVPAEASSEIPKDVPIHVIVLFPDVAEDREWQRLTYEQFLAGYGEGDHIYDAI